MVLKIPRYASQETAKISSSRSLTTGTQTGGAIAEIGNIALQKASEYGARKNSHDAQLRRLEINTNKDLSASMMFGKTSAFENSLETREDFLTPDNWLQDYENSSKKWEESFKKGLDQQTWTQYQPLYFQKYFEGRNAVVKKINNQKLKNAGHAFNEANQSYKSSVENATSLRSIEANFELYNELHLKKNAQTNLFSKDKYEEVKEETKKWTNNKYGMLQVTKDLIIKSPNGSQEIDWNNATSRLKDKNFTILDIDGNELTVDDDLRKSLIKEATDSYTNQESLHKKQKEKKDKITKDGFVNTLIGMTSGDEESLKDSKNYLSSLEKSNLDPATKLKYKNAYTATLKNLKEGTATYDSVQGQQALSIVTFLVGTGTMDTEEEREVIWDLMSKNLLEPKTALSLSDKSISLTKEKNKFKKDLANRATRMLMKEVGADENVLNLIGNLQNLKSKERTGALLAALDSGKLTKESYNAMNNMFRLLATGERKGFTYENMLVNRRSPNYILQDLVDTYKTTVNDENLQMLQTKIDGMKGAIKGDKSFYIEPTEYFINKTASNANLDMPKRIEGEDVYTYIQRASKSIKKTDGLPSVVTGKNIETIDLSDLNITPNF